MSPRFDQRLRSWVWGVVAGVMMLLVVSAPTAAQTWIELAPTGGPPDPRVAHTSVYNTAANRMIVFGGSNALQFVFVPPSIALRNDVWVLSNADGTDASPPTWTQLSPTGGPPSKRGVHTAVYDPNTNRMIVFAGNPNIGSCFGAVNDVWLLENADGFDLTTGLPTTPNWTQLSPTGGPPSPRRAHVAAYDPATNRMIVYAGANPCLPGLNEVWVLENANGIDIATGLPATPNWTQLSPSGTPLPLIFLPDGVYDPTTNRLIVLAATSNTSGLTDVRVLENANGLDITTGLPATPNWVQLFPTGGPPEAEFASVVYDPTSNRIVIFGGGFGPDPGGRLNETWILTNANGTEATPPAWTQLSPTGGPPIRRDDQTAIYNSVSNRMTVFGGRGCITAGPCTILSEFSTFSDVWVLTNANGGLGDSDGECVRTQGFWKNHPDEWPVDELELGDLLYNQAELLVILSEPVHGNGLVSLAKQLIAAKLNQADGAPAPADVQDAIDGADGLIGGLVVPPSGNGFVSPDDSEEFQEPLDEYNNGEFPDGPVSCDELEDDEDDEELPPCEGEPLSCSDLNGDGVVDACDLILLLAAWGVNPGHPADCDGDGTVNAFDLALLLGSWTGGPLPAGVQACFGQFSSDGDLAAFIACVEAFCNCE